MYLSSFFSLLLFLLLVLLFVVVVGCCWLLLNHISYSIVTLLIGHVALLNGHFTHDVHHSWLKATPPLPPVMVMVMMMAVVTVVGSIELLYPSHHLAPHVGISSLISEW